MDVCSYGRLGVSGIDHALNHDYIIILFVLYANREWISTRKPTRNPIDVRASRGLLIESQLS